MATIFKCKMCDGNLVIKGNSTTFQCEFCGTVQTIPLLDDEKKVNLFNRANRLRYNNEFDSAAHSFESITAEYPEEAEAYWGLCLCKYGIEYVDDPVSAKKVPTCHRTNLKSIFDDDDYLQAYEYASTEARRLYRGEAKSIDLVQQEILTITKDLPPYDIYICCKENDDAGERTKDSVLAQGIYDALIENGYRVFWSRIELENKKRWETEPYIFGALNSSKIMLVIGTNVDHFNDVWMRNEWGRFWRFLRKDNSRLLIPCFTDIDPSNMPKEFNGLQGQDMGKVAFLQDLLKVISEKLPNKSSASNSVVQSLLKNGNEALKSAKWSDAKKLFDEVLDINSDEPMACVGLLLCDLKVRLFEELGNYPDPIDGNYYYQRILGLGNAKIAKQLETINNGIIERISFNKYNEPYREAKSILDNATTEDDYLLAASKFKQMLSYKDSAALAETCESRRREFVYSNAVKLITSASTEKDFYSAYYLFDKIKGYKNSDQKQEQCRQNSLSEFYSEAKNLMNSGKYQDAAEKFYIIKEYKDADALKTRCINACDKMRNDSIYAEARSLENAKGLENYEKAISLYSQIPGWLDSNKRQKNCRIKAVSLKIKNNIDTDNDKKDIKLLKRRRVAVGFSVIAMIIAVAGVVFLWLTVISPFRISNGVLNKYMGFSTNVTIPNSISQIGNYAFAGKGSLQSVVIPDSVTRIGHNAFEGCSSLIEIKIPDGVTSIENETFKDCTSLVKCPLPECVESIGNGAFEECSSLEEISIPQSVNSIGARAFCGCATITNIFIPDRITTIEDGVFSGCTSLKSIKLPDKITSIGEDAFYSCAIENICIPETVTGIGCEAFKRCSSLTTVIIPEGVTSIESELFSGCSSLTDITMPSGITSIGSGAFSSCPFKNITIPKNVTIIGSDAFRECNSLTDFLIPDGVTSIGHGAFYRCNKIKQIKIPDNVSFMGNYVFFQCYDIQIQYKGKTYDFDHYDQLQKLINGK